MYMCTVLGFCTRLMLVILTHSVFGRGDSMLYTLYSDGYSFLERACTFLYMYNCRSMPFCSGPPDFSSTTCTCTCSWLGLKVLMQLDAPLLPAIAHTVLVSCTRYNAFVFHTCGKCVWERCARISCAFASRLRLVCSVFVFGNAFAYPCNIRPRARVKCKQCSMQCRPISKPSAMKVGRLRTAAESAPRCTAKMYVIVVAQSYIPHFTPPKPP